MFRIKLKIDPQLLQQFYTRVKTGVRGLGFVRTKADVEWPADLQVKLPKPPEANAPAVPPTAVRRGDPRSQDNRQRRVRNQGPRRQMIGNAIAKVTNVSHRYGATVSLDDVSIDIPARIMVGVIGPDGVGKSTLLGADRRGEEDSAGGGPRLRQGRRRQVQPEGDPRPHRLYAAGARPQSLSDAERVREHRLLRPAVRAGRRRAARRASPSSSPRRRWRSSRPARPASSPAA